MAEKYIFAEVTMDEAATVFKALADSNRLRILDTLIQGDSCNCELKDRLGLPANLLSHHLGILRKAKLIHSRRDALDGRWIYYAANQAAIAQWQIWFSEFFDPSRIQLRPQLCGPEGRQETSVQSPSHSRRTK